MTSRPKDAHLVEALLFAASSPLTVAQLRARLPEDVDLEAALTELQAIYRDRGVHLQQREGAWALRTAPDVAAHLVFEKRQQQKLSRAALETLAIIAYHQPVTRAEIEGIRGVAVSKGTIDVLVEAGWVAPGKRRETPGRPLTWISTRGFLDHFGLAGLKDLPGLKDLADAGLLRSGVEIGLKSGLLGDGDGGGLFDQMPPTQPPRSADAAADDDSLMDREDEEAERALDSDGADD